MLEREIIRYSAYFKGWCQAFGEHDGIQCKESGIDWLLADHQLGLVLPPDTVRSLHREVLLHRHTPTLDFRPDAIEIGALRIPLEKKQEKKALDAVAEILAPDVRRRQPHHYLLEQEAAADHLQGHRHDARAVGLNPACHANPSRCVTPAA